jgi:Ca-activated chloride channel family protein
MFRFENPEYLYLLFIIPVLIGWYIYTLYKKRADIKKFGDIKLLKALMPGVSSGRPVVKFILLLVVLTGLICMLARPQLGAKRELIKRKGIEVMIALDVSNSMLAQDVLPDRLERSKQILYRLVDGLDNDKLGLVVFAGKSYIQLPLTRDYRAAKMYISNITPELVNQQGTAIGSAINLCTRSFSSQEGLARSLIVITDGENHEDDAAGAAKAAFEKGIQVHVMGIGTPEGKPIPIPGTSNFRRDKEGNIVISKLNEQMCRDIARAGHGTYIRADNSNLALRTIEEELNKSAKEETEGSIYSEYNEQFQWIAWIVWALLLLEFCILERKNKYFSKIKLFKNKNY